MAASYVNTPYESVATEALTEAAPTLATEGFSVSPGTGWYLCLAAELTRTLSGGGNLYAYVYDSFVGAWARAPEWDWAVPAGASGNRYAISKLFSFPVPRKLQLAYIANGVTVSGGTTCQVMILTFPRGSAAAKV